MLNKTSWNELMNKTSVEGRSITIKNRLMVNSF